MNIENYARSLLLGGSIEEKLCSTKIIDEGFAFYKIKKDVKCGLPNRNQSIEFSDKQIKFPKKGSFHRPEKIAMALHFFANHELLAIEMMAWALLKFKEINGDLGQFRRGLLKTISDEQKHFKLYLSRMNDLGVSFGSFPINNFFWRQIEKVETPEEFYAMVALTFEQANLDFAKYYAQVFEDVGDKKTAEIMNIVYEDEISHVKLGVHWLEKWKESEHSLWNYYVSLLPENITPQRAKGIIFDREGRQMAGLKHQFIDELVNYKDEFNITTRKEW